MSVPTRHLPSWKVLRRKKNRLQTLLARNKRKLLRAGALVCALVFLFLGGLYIAYSRDLPDPQSLSERIVRQSTKIYDRTGEHLLYEIHGEENRTLIPMAQGFCDPDVTARVETGGIPLHAIQATIAAEDRQFCHHRGFSMRGILRALYTNTIGPGRAGGSTLTQQLVKNAFLTNEKRLSRKIKELMISVEIERRFSKDEILQIYFNEIPYGSTNYGIEAASQSYFGKTASDLTLAEAATLAALPQRPSTFLNRQDLLQNRRDHILRTMAELYFVTPEEAETSIAEPLELRPRLTNIEAPHFVFYVKELLEEKYDPRLVEEGGLRVITSLDWEKQLAAEEILSSGVEERGERYGFTNAALVALEPGTGHILAMVGSRDYFNEEIDGQVNVTLRPRQPGSSFKPFVYTLGFLTGYTPETILWDVKTEFATDTGSYSPNDYDLGERGPLTVRTALQGSLNIPAVQMAYLVGVRSLVNFAQTLGYTTITDAARYGLSIALGGGEVTLLEHTNAYATLAREGHYLAPVAILRVEDQKGELLEEWKALEPAAPVIEPNTARITTSVLSDNAARGYIFGTGSALQLGERPVAAKSGTTNDTRDGWLMGYTPQLATGVWVGNNDNSAMHQGADGSVVAGPMWNAFMRRALQDQPVIPFAVPERVATGKPILDGVMPGERVVIDRASGKRATERTPLSFREERLFAEYHSILHYVVKQTPRGPAPEHPEQDPQYASWEAAVNSWLTRRAGETGVPISSGSPPSDYDDVHVPENIPFLQILSPAPEATVSQNSVDVSVNAFSRRGVTRVEVWFDGSLVETRSVQPFVFSVRIPASATRGFHSLRLTAYDDIDNAASETVSLLLDREGTPSGVSLLSPRTETTFNRSQGALSIEISIENALSFEEVRLMAQRIATGTQEVIGTRIRPSENHHTFSWMPGEIGDYTLFVRGERAGPDDDISSSVLIRVQGDPPGDAPQPLPDNPFFLSPFQAVSTTPHP